ncbi:malate dehydrogenase [Escherichia coli]|nr:malate dehydrogenase [Escherichia coli]
MKVAVLGAAGGIGQALALLLKTQLPSGSELSLYDIAPVTPRCGRRSEPYPYCCENQRFFW